ncbi:ACT domain-containing protein [Ectothiorhodospira lacustris]|uniref:ACT domain-containing protein n=1 Tax=Ectothiorhodospira lacustris TaxID=2899127 RepID=UPI001EE8629F|nr:ACT domain-containing protein [Ectothiorhodospira lacustris]MCG5500589.1 amino acid-binding protein [Ectothiorhodospira lacustris]MCG5508782.1 amino acid-binding protein [Ectothiorhodospira lacustris]MCG5520573.1 amino acid-binding protein [Ectothiorhodospira lacustris]
MKLQQLSVFLENRPGHLAEPLALLSRKGINILSLSLADTADFGILRMIVRDWEQAAQALKADGWVVKLTEVVAVDVEDRPGGLAEVLQAAGKAELKIEYMYAFSLRRNNRAALIFRFEEPDRAIDALSAAGCHVIEAEALFAAVE